MIEEVLAAAGVAMAAAPGYEADDVIGTLAARADGPVEVVTGDRDLFQLVDDARQVRVIYTARGLSKLDVVDEAWVTAKYGIPGRSYASYAVLRGDPSDGLPGVAGVGDKTAAALVRAIGEVDDMIAALDKGHGGFPAGSRAKLAASRDYLEAAVPVVRVATDAPVPEADGALPVTPADPAALARLDARWDLGSSLGRMSAALACPALRDRPARYRTRSQNLERHQAGVVLGLGRAQRVEDGDHGLLRVAAAVRRGGQPGQAVVQRLVAPLDQPVAVEQQQVAGVAAGGGGRRSSRVPAPSRMPSGGVQRSCAQPPRTRTSGRWPAWAQVSFLVTGSK